MIVLIIVPTERKKFFIAPFYYSILSFREKEESELILEKDRKLPITIEKVFALCPYLMLELGFFFRNKLHNEESTPERREPLKGTLSSGLYFSPW